MPLTEALAIQHLSFRYDSKETLTDITFSVDRGDYVGLVGPNGSGKTTLVKIILGLTAPLTGTVSLFGANVRDFHEWEKIGYLPQITSPGHLFFPATVTEIVGLGLVSGKKRRQQQRREAIERALALMDIADLREKLIGELSGGQQQRVLLARAVVNEPEMLVLDEPTSAVDPETREKFFGLLKQLNEERGITNLLVTHDIGNIGKYARKLLYLDKRIMFYGDFNDFCLSGDMTNLFGAFSQHIICHRHD